MNPNAARNQKIKMALIPVLGVIFLVVMWPASEDMEGVEDANGVISSPTLVADPALAVAAPTARWPKVDLATATQFNPFAPPRPPDKVAVAEEGVGNEDGSEVVTDSKASISSRKVRSAAAVIERDGKAYAYIDGEFAAVGDTLQGGGKVVTITADAVVVEGS